MGLPVLLAMGSIFATGQAQRMDGSQGSEIVLGPKVRILLAAGEPSPVRLAAEDVAADFGKVTGTKTEIVEQDSSPATGPTTILLGESARLPEAMRPVGLVGAESFSIAVKKGDAEPEVVLAGADMRGTIYALYQFSQEFLGVDPMYYWTDKEPAKSARIELPAGLDEVFPAPVFKYRGFFLNDEDLLTGWAPGEKTDRTGISMAVWNKVFETILRLKGNMVVPGTWIFPNDPQVKLAASGDWS